MEGLIHPTTLTSSAMWIWPLRTIGSSIWMGKPSTVYKPAVQLLQLKEVLHRLVHFNSLLGRLHLWTLSIAALVSFHLSHSDHDQPVPIVSVCTGLIWEVQVIVKEAVRLLLTLEHLSLLDHRRM